MVYVDASSQYDVIMTLQSSIEEDSKKYHQNFLLCNNNEITACIADLFNSFCEEVYAVAVFKVVVEFYLYPTVGTVLIHSVKPELTEQDVIEYG